MHQKDLSILKKLFLLTLLLILAVSTVSASIVTKNYTYYLFDAADPQYTTYKQMKNATVNGTIYDSSLEQSIAGILCWNIKWLAPNFTFQTWVNGTWEFNIYGYCQAGARPANLFARIIKYNGTEYEVLNTTTCSTNLCADTNSPGSSNKWSYNVSYSQLANLSVGERIGVQICASISQKKNNQYMHIQWEGTTPSYVNFPNSYVDNPPIINLNLPANNTQFNDTQDINFNFTAIDDFNSTLRCEIILDGVTKQINSSVGNNTLTNFFITGINYGDHNWYISCEDGLDKNSSEIRYFSIRDTIPPAWSNNQSNIPTKYSESQPSIFNITWTDNVGVSTVLIEGNWSGSPQNYTATLISGNVWGYNETLPAGTFYWKSYANDTSGNWNSTDAWQFVIDKADNPVTLLINGSASNLTIVYGEVSNVTASSKAGTVYLYRNGSIVTNPDIGILGAGVYVYFANATGNANYTDNSTGVNYNLTVLKAQSNCSLTFDKSSPQYYGTELTVTCSCTNPELSAKLYRNGSDVTSENGTAVILPAGVWEYVCNVSESENYTSSSNSSSFVIDKAPTQVRLFLNGTEGNRNYNLSDVANITVVVNVSGKTVYLDTNLSGWVQQSGTSPLTNITILSEVGYFNITGSFLGDANYSASSQTYYINVTDSAPPVILSTNPTNGSTFPSGTTTQTIIVVTDESAECRYGKASDVWSNMTEFDHTNTTSHNFTATGLIDGLTYNYYILCQDIYGNLMSQSYLLQFKIQAKEAPSESVWHGSTVPPRNVTNGTTQTNVTNITLPTNISTPQIITNIDSSIKIDALNKKELRYVIINPTNKTLYNVRIEATAPDNLEIPKPINYPNRIGWNLERLTGWSIVDDVKDPRLTKWNIQPQTIEKIEPNQSIETQLTIFAPLTKLDSEKINLKVYAGNEEIQNKTINVDITNPEFYVTSDYHNDSETADIYILINKKELANSKNINIEFNINDGSRTIIYDIFGPYTADKDGKIIIAQKYHFADYIGGKVYKMHIKVYDRFKLVGEADGNLNLTQKSYKQSFSLFNR